MTAPPIHPAKYYRPLGLHERYSLVRAQVGYPVILSIVAKVTPVTSRAVFVEHIEARIDALLSAYPLLSASITDDRTSQPGFYCTGEQYTHHRVLQVRTGVDKSLVVEGNEDLTALHILQAELWDCGEGGAALSSLQGPMWRVVLHQEEGYSWLSLSTSHTITDGKGLANLFELLLASDIEGLLPVISPADIPPSSDEVLGTAPSYRYLVSVLWAELVVPKLPFWLQRLVKSPQYWPATVPIKLAESTPQIDLVLLEADLIEKLRKAAQSKGIKTITPLLHSAAFVSLFSMIGQQETMLSATPISMRNQIGPKATPCTGNYVSSADWTLQASPDMSLWSITRAYAALLTDSNTAKRGLQGVGMLSYIPDEMHDPPALKQPTRSTIDKANPCSWEHFFRKKSQSLSPYSASFDLTNIGLIKTQAQIKNVVWSPSPRPMGAALLISVIGFSSQGAVPSNGLSLTLATRKGLVDGDTFARRMKKAVTVFAKGTLTSDHATIGELADLILD